MVVHCKQAEYDVYIGRPSEWGNPWTHKAGTRARFIVPTREEAIERYRENLWWQVRTLGQPFVEKLAALHGKRLGCWCHPLPCHGDVLVKAAAWAHTELQSS